MTGTRTGANLTLCWQQATKPDDFLMVCFGVELVMHGGSEHCGVSPGLAHPLSPPVLYWVLALCVAPLASLLKQPVLVWWIFKPLGFLQTLPHLQTALLILCPHLLGHPLGYFTEGYFIARLWGLPLESHSFGC